MTWRSPIGRGNRRAMLSSVMRGQHSYRSPLKSVQWKFKSSRQDNAFTVITSFNAKNDIEVIFGPLAKLVHAADSKSVPSGCQFKSDEGY